MDRKNLRTLEKINCGTDRAVANFRAAITENPSSIYHMVNKNARAASPVLILGPRALVARVARVPREARELPGA